MDGQMLSQLLYTAEAYAPYLIGVGLIGVGFVGMMGGFKQPNRGGSHEKFNYESYVKNIKKLHDHNITRGK